MEKLRIGILLESLIAPAWVRHAIERVVRSDSAELALVVVKSGAPLKKAKAPFIFRAYDALDKKVFLRGADALTPASLNEWIAGTPVLPAQSTPAGLTVFSPAEVEQIRAARLDVLINFEGNNPLQQDLLAALPYGAWAYKFQDAPLSGATFVGYTETVAGETLTEASLCAWRAGDAAPQILFRSGLSTYKLSVARNRNAILWFASTFLARQLQSLRHLGPERFFQETARFQAVLPAAPRPALPSNWQSLQNIIRVVRRGAQEYALRSRVQDTWSLWYDFHETPMLNGEKFKQIFSPPDRFWADPWVIQHQERYYIFVEEYPYDRAKGHIAVVEMDARGNVKAATPILEKDYHLSYPCVFEHAGKYWMIPESSSNQTIDLYECVTFPTQWRHKTTLFKGVRAVDTTLLFHKDKWWLFTAMRENSGAYLDVELHLFFADSLFTPHWTPHPLNPIVSDVAKARPAGKIFLQDGRLIRPSQDCAQTYGHHINLNEITCLTETDYKEITRLTIQPNWAPGLQGAHTFGYDTHLTVVDAFSRQPKPGKHRR